MTVKGKVGDCAHAVEVLQRRSNPSASNCRSRHATAVLVFWHHTQPRPSLIDVPCSMFHVGPLTRLTQSGLVLPRAHFAPAARNSKRLSRLKTRETPSTTPGYTNGTVKMVRGRSRFLDDARHTLCEE